MALETLITTAVLSAFTNVKTVEIIKDFLDSLNRKEPVRQDDNEGFILERPSNRLGVVKTIINGKEALAIYLEKDEGSAYNEAMALQKKEPSRVSVKVIGFAQAVMPTLAVSKQISGNKQLVIGSSVSHIHGLAGSLGAFVKFKQPKRQGEFKGFTSAAHVFGCNNIAQNGDPIISPGRPDIVADIQYRVGTLAKCSYLTHYSEQNDPNAVLNKNDIAVAEL